VPYLNRIFVMGHLGRDVEVRTIPSGKAVANFSVATTEKWKDKGGSPQERTTWHRVTKWEPPDWMVAGLTKGSLVYVEGSLTSREYEKDGQKHTAYEINANTVLLLAGRERTAGQMAAAGSYVPDDVPFGRMPSF
jgi:single-strand DNA-binding protein